MPMRMRENIGHALAVVTQAFLPVSVGQGFKLPEPGAGTVHAIPNQKCFCMTRTEKVIDVRVDLFMVSKAGGLSHNTYRS